MLILIFCILYFGAIAFAIEYCFDMVDIEKLENISKTDMPDLNDTPITEKTDLQNYVDKIIIPAHKFYELKDNIKELQDDTRSDIHQWLVLQGFGVMLMTFKINSMFSIHLALCCLISICLCVPICLIGSKIYRKSKYAITQFGYDPETFQCQFESHYKEVYKENYKKYKLNKNILWNVYVINFQGSYLSSVWETVLFRHSCRKILSAVALIIYVVFFFTVPE